jgi:hypothetical protein
MSTSALVLGHLSLMELNNYRLLQVNNVKLIFISSLYNKIFMIALVNKKFN